MSEESTPITTNSKMLRPTIRRRAYPQYAASTNRDVPVFIKKLMEPSHSAYKFVPYWNPPDYLRDLRASGSDTTELEKLYNENPPENHVLYPPKPKMNINFAPVQALYDRYAKQGKMPPIDERLQALNAAGYPEEVLLDVMKKHDKRIKDGPELEKFIHAIFGDIGDKKPTAAKKKTLHQLLKIKKRVYAQPEPDDEETPVDNDELCGNDDEL